VDFRYLLENYAAAGNVDRLYGEEFPLLAACDYGFERAGPRLLGMDISAIASAGSKQQIVGILSNPRLHDRLVMHMLRGESHDTDAAEVVGNQLAEFTIGLTNWPTP
jgi:predicted nucleotidyltransferase